MPAETLKTLATAWADEHRIVVLSLPVLFKGHPSFGNDKQPTQLKLKLEWKTHSPPEHLLDARDIDSHELPASLLVTVCSVADDRFRV